MNNDLPVNSIRPKYPHDSAGNILTTEIPVFKPTTTVGEIKTSIVDGKQDYESINYIYIVDNDSKLAGVLSIKDIFRNDEKKHASEMMSTEVVYAHPYTNQEKVSMLSLKHKLKAIPILDKDRNFMGVVTSDTILQVMHEELSEDLLKFVGMHTHKAKHDDIMSLSVKDSLLHRLPWILIGLFGGILIAETMGFFEDTLQEHIILAAFVPLMVYMSNAIGQQVSAFVIRDAAINSTIHYMSYFWKHTGVIFLMSVILSIVMFVYSMLFYQDLNISRVLAVALFGTSISSVITGFGIPYIFIKLKQDPANATGPIATIIQDLLSVIIYLVIAVSLIS
jgi:magnesium transporter